jgi:hypothetical protein
LSHRLTGSAKVIDGDAIVVADQLISLRPLEWRGATEGVKAG